jgi:hypothetical protein
MPTPEALVSCLTEYAAEPIHWLWPGRLAAGKLTLIDGDPSQGKSLVTLDVISRFSTARALPDGYQPPKPVGAVLLSAEDGVADTILPRLRAAGADVQRVHLFEGHGTSGLWQRLPSFPEDCHLLEGIIRNTDAGLVVVDPLMAFLSTRCFAANDQLVRQALGPLARVAAATQSALVLVRHLNKGGSGQKAVYRGSGSIAITGAARTAFLVGQDSEDPEPRLLACTKNNLAAFPPTLGFRIAHQADGHPVVAWDGVIEATADELVLAAPRHHGEALAEAVKLLRDLLEPAPVSCDEVTRRARAAGISERTLDRAKDKLGVVSQQCRRHGHSLWFWCLPEDAGSYGPDNWDDPDYRREQANRKEMERFWEHLGNPPDTPQAPHTQADSESPSSLPPP